MVSLVFQPYTNGYLITTVETLMLTGKRNPPIWLIILTAMATLVVLVGGIVLLMFYHTSGGPSSKMDTFLGTLALLVMILFPAFMVSQYYLQLENPITIHRESIKNVEHDGARLTILAKTAIKNNFIRLVLLTRSEEEAMTIHRNLSVHTNGRLRVYPITYLPIKQRFLSTLAQTEIHFTSVDRKNDQ